MYIPGSLVYLLLSPEVPHLLEWVGPLSLLVLASVVPLLLWVPAQGERGEKQLKNGHRSVILANHIQVCSNPLIEYYFHKQTNTQWMDFQFGIPYSGTFSWGAKLGVFRGQTEDAKMINSHTLVFHMQNYWWVWFPRNETRVLEPTNISAEGSEAIANICTGSWSAKISLYTVVPKLVQGILHVC